MRPLRARHLRILAIATKSHGQSGMPSMANHRLSSSVHGDEEAVLGLTPAFRPLTWVIRRTSDKAVVRANVAAGLFWLLVLVTASYLDGTLDMPGRAVGLFEHPSIFAFLLAYCVAPISIPKAAALILTLHQWTSDVFQDEFRATEVETLIANFRNYVRRQNTLGRTTYTLIFLLGVIPFAWNSYANQIPFQHAGFDFWDSALHPWGYWATRVFKLYFWTFFFPSTVHICLGIVLTIRSLILKADQERSLILDPFHPDRCGGLRRFVDVVLLPLAPSLAAGGIMAFGAVMVHRKLDLTTGGAVALFLVLLVLIYLILALPIRSVAKAEKIRQLGVVGHIQHLLYEQVLQIGSDKDGESIVARINALSDLASKIRDVPNWPRLHSVLKAASLLVSSPIFGLAAGLALDLLKARLLPP